MKEKGIDVNFRLPFKPHFPKMFVKIEKNKARG